MDLPITTITPFIGWFERYHPETSISDVTETVLLYKREISDKRVFRGYAKHALLTFYLKLVLNGLTPESFNTLKEIRDLCIDEDYRNRKRIYKMVRELYPRLS